MDIEKILGRIRAALVKLDGDPAVHCSGCGKAMPIMPVRVENENPNEPDGPWTCSNWSYAKLDGWMAVKRLDSYGGDKNFCPDCAKKHLA